MLNPNIQDSPSIMIQYVDYGAAKPLTYPDLSDVLQLAAGEMDGVSEYRVYKILMCATCTCSVY